MKIAEEFIGPMARIFALNFCDTTCLIGKQQKLKGIET